MLYTDDPEQFLRKTNPDLTTDAIRQIQNKIRLVDAENDFRLKKPRRWSRACTAPDDSWRYSETTSPFRIMNTTATKWRSSAVTRSSLPRCGVRTCRQGGKSVHKVSFKTYFLKTVERMRAAYDICQPSGELGEEESALAQCFMAIAGFVRKMSASHIAMKVPTSEKSVCSLPLMN